VLFSVDVLVCQNFIERKGSSKGVGRKISGGGGGTKKYRKIAKKE